MYIILVILIVLMLVGGFHPGITSNYGYWPSGGIGLVVLILIILLVMGRL